MLKPKPAEILLRLTTEIDRFTTDDLLDRPDSDGVAIYRGEILVADGVDEELIAQGFNIEHDMAGEIVALHIDIKQLLSATKKRGEKLEDVLIDYGLTNRFTEGVLRHVKDDQLVLGRKVKPASKILYIAQMKLHEDYRNRDIGIFSLCGCIERVADKDTMVLMPLRPLQFSAIEHEVENCRFYTGRKNDAIASLTRHFQKLMFEPLPASVSKDDIESDVILYRPAVLAEAQTAH